MRTAVVNGVRLAYQITGDGEVPLVLVHGSWVSHRNWDAVVPALGRSFRVVRYDRRGHSASERPQGRDSIRDDVADLAGLIEQLGLVPAFVAGNSFGGTIALRLVAERPDLLRGVMAHEPPLVALLAGAPEYAPMLEEVSRRFAAVVQRIAAGDDAGAAEQFVETVALGPGEWEDMDPEEQRIAIENARTFLGEVRDPEGLTVDLDRLGQIDVPVLLTLGDQSPPTFAPVVQRLAAVMRRCEVITIGGAGHIPHVTHPERYVEVVGRFAGAATRP